MCNKKVELAGALVVFMKDNVFTDTTYFILFCFKKDLEEQCYLKYKET